MLRYQLFLSVAIALGAIWWAALQSSVGDTLWVKWAPLEAVIVLGLYAVGSIAIGLANFRDFPEAAAELDGQIQEAKKEMTRRKIIQKE